MLKRNSLKKVLIRQKSEFQKELDELKDKYLKSIAKLDDACANLEIYRENEKN